METQKEFDFESFKKEVISGLYSGKKMSGGDGVLAPLISPQCLFLQGLCTIYATPQL